MKLSRKEYIVFGLILALMQVLDGVLTYWGVSRFGTGVEGNPLVKSLIETFGAEPTLFSLKLLGVFLSWVFVKLRAAKALVFMAGLYSGVVLIWLRFWFFTTLGY